ncbi:MAG TPA: thioredoxin [Longimicrobiales bacterium]|nr:thioredoxin [Longimicrobiales bacterium]
MSEHVRTLTDADFAAEVEGQAGLAVVDLGAEWCAPCRYLEPVVEELAREYAGRVRVARVDTEESPVTAAKYGVRSLPTLLFFRDGREVKRVVGALPRAVLARHFEAHLEA